MKRSTVNEIIASADEFIRSFGFHLPPFAYFTPDEMVARKAEISNIINSRLGWDITDFGAGDFDKMGLFLFTTRNGQLEDCPGSGRWQYRGRKTLRSYTPNSFHPGGSLSGNWAAAWRTQYCSWTGYGTG